MTEYVAMAKANLAWVAWRDDDAKKAESLGTEALELWHGMEDPYNFDWMARWPLIAVAISRNDTACAIDHARALLLENQHPLPQKLASLTQEAINSWEEKRPEAALANFEHALRVAHELGQL
jgi:hypothetical protein